jgi:nucleotide-binding universal stress UspA family protein
MAETNDPTVVSAGLVVVGVNGGLAGCRQALIFAAREARLRKTAIRLVHGCEPFSTLSEWQPRIPLEARERQARRQLRDAAEALRPLLDPGTTVQFRIDPRTGIDTLLDQSGTAGLIVVQRRDLTTLGRIRAGSTSNAVAARASCPVVVIRAGQGVNQGRGAVLIGIDDDITDADHLLQLAFAEAAARKVQLTAIQVTTGHTDSRLAWRSGQTEAANSLAAVALDRWTDRFPEVMVNQLTTSGDAVEALRVASVSADVLVVGRHLGQGPEMSGLGDAVGRLLSSAQCPILVAPPTRTATGGDRSRVGSVSNMRRRSTTSRPC